MKTAKKKRTETHSYREPYKYKPEMCGKVVAMMGKGHTLTACAAVLNVSRETIYEWTKLYPAFGNAFNLGRAKQQLAWERRGIKVADTNEGSTGMCIFALKSISQGDWRDNQETPPQTTVTVNVSYDAALERVLQMIIGDEQDLIEGTARPVGD